jgi:hypothetical protein
MGKRMNRGRPQGLTGGPHARRRWLPNRLPHLPGERAAPSRRRLGRAELGRRGFGPRRGWAKGKAGREGGGDDGGATG